MCLSEGENDDKQTLHFQPNPFMELSIAVFDCHPLASTIHLISALCCPQARTGCRATDKSRSRQSMEESTIDSPKSTLRAKQKSRKSCVPAQRWEFNLIQALKTCSLLSKFTSQEMGLGMKPQICNGKIWKANAKRT